MTAGGAEAGSLGAAAGGAPTEGGDCYVALSENSSNAIDPTTPISDVCRATTFDGQINFEAVQPDERDLNIDFFAPPVAGASVKLEDGFDFAAHQGAVASYIDSAGVWNADSGTVSIVSVKGDAYVVKLANVHFAVQPGQPFEPTATGDFVANGTISATAMPSK